MRNYILKRIGLIVVTAFIIIFLEFVIVKSMPDFYRPELGIDPEWYEALKEKEGYNKPILEQFGIWIRNIVVDGNFGYSVKQSRDAILIVRDRIPETVKINIIPYLISIPIGIGLGIIAALKKNKIADHLISLGVMILISVPSFVIAVLMQYYVVYEWNWLDHAFVLPQDMAALDPFGAFTSRILPTVVLALGSIAGWTRGIRAELTEVLTQDFMLLGRTKGLSKTQATIRHGLRNAMVPFAPSIVGGFIGLLSGSMIIEGTFRINGIGGVYLQAFQDRDYSLLMLIMMFYTVIGLAAALIGDLSYGIIDPRIRMGSGKE
ncbi:ABC transporter permease [Acholeplasma sp. OttesenSCG-928-E16]|nr:ABC transporter permease [Acholeplasma sp. OttesenSCG-928-E16]